MPLSLLITRYYAMRLLIFFAVTSFVFCACVPNRKIVYLQKDDVNKQLTPKDSIVRTYDLKLSDYKIQPQDLLSINFETLTPEEFDFMAKLSSSNQGGGNALLFVNGFLVDNDGNVEFPVTGKVKLAGLSIFEAQEKLQNILKAYLKEPVARVRLLNFRFTILGEVRGESQIVSQNVRVNMMEAIGMAGGFSELADRQNVKVVRQNGGISEVFYINLLDENFIASPFYYLQQNDVIIVPALKQRPFRTYFGPNLSLFVSTISTILFIYTIVDNNN